MPEVIRFVNATPVLPSLDIRRSVDFLVSGLGFEPVHAAQGEYGIVRHGPVAIHFWACSDPGIPRASSCRIEVRAIAELHERCGSLGIVHPHAPLQAKPWGGSEFAILDPDGNLITFFEPVAA